MAYNIWTKPVRSTLPVASATVSNPPDDGFRRWGMTQCHGADWCQDPTDECSIQSWGKDGSGPLCFEQHGSHPHHGVDPPPSEIIIRGLETVAEGTGSVDLTDFVHIAIIFLNGAESAELRGFL